MVAVFVSDQNSIEGLGGFTDCGETGHRFFAAETGVNEEARMLGPDKNRVSGTARRQHADLQFLVLLWRYFTTTNILEIV